MENNASNSRLKRILFWGLGLSATASAGFFGWNWWKNRHNNVDDLDTGGFSTGATSTSKGTSSSSSKGISSAASNVTKSDFPLKKGSKGYKVQRLQFALIQKYGRSLLPKYGADGDFGSETVNALKSKGYATSISSSLYQKIVGLKNNSSSSFDAGSLGIALFKATNSNDYTKAIELLGRISNPSQYSKVSSVFKQYRIGGGVRKTLVTGMLDTFDSPFYKEPIRQHFFRMGLIYSSGKWSLPSLGGVDFKRVLTLVPTTLYDFKHQVKIKTPKGMIIGYLIQQKQGATLFRTLEKNKKLIVSSSDIQII